jgi:heat shock protein HslJ
MGGYTMFIDSVKSTCIKVLTVMIISASPLFSAGLVSAHSDLTGVTWLLEELNHSSANISGYTMQFTRDSTVSSHMDCNSCSYKYTASQQTISFRQGMCTMMACAGTSREGEFSTAIMSVAKWNIAGTRLFLMDATDTVMVFADSAASRLTGHPWLLYSIRQDSGRTKISNPENYTVAFHDDGSVGVKADCNTCGGTYSENPGASLLSISSLACTKMGCGSDSKGDLFAAILGNVSRYSIKSDTLYCYVAADTLVFTGPSTAVRRNMPSASGASVKTGISIILKNRMMTVRLKGNAIVHARLLDVRGVCVRSQDRIVDNRVVFSTAGLPAGVYLVRMRTGSGETVRRSVCLAR